MREISEMGYDGGYTTVKAYLRDIRPPARTQFERRFETPAGKQAQVDFAEFTVSFTDEPGVTRKVWLFSIVLGHSRWLWGALPSCLMLLFCVDRQHENTKQFCPPKRVSFSS